MNRKRTHIAKTVCVRFFAAFLLFFTFTYYLIDKFRKRRVKSE